MSILDYAWSQPPASFLKANGVTAVSRYLSWLPNGKVIGSAEANDLISNGIDIFLNWEFNATDQLGGYNVGAIHAHEAVRQAYNLGYPKGATIYFSGDFDITDAQKPVAGQYMSAARAYVHQCGMRIGAYGGYWYVKYMFDNGLIDDGWQAYAWSGGQWDPRAHLRQVRNGYPFGTYDVDLDTSIGATYSWLHPAVATPPPPVSPPIAVMPPPQVITVQKGQPEMFLFKTPYSDTVYASDGIRYRSVIDLPTMNALIGSGAVVKPTGSPVDGTGYVLIICADPTTWHNQAECDPWIPKVGGILDTVALAAPVDVTALAAALANDLPVTAAQIQAAVVAALQSQSVSFVTK